jgi:tetratricopeptide (TPR) repeat protein
LQAQSLSPREQLNQYVADLQKNPNDAALREKIIKLVVKLTPKPEVPEEVRRFEGAAEFAFKNATGESDFLDAAKQYEKALLIAPWIGEDYFNAGIAYEKARRLQEAVRSLELYLLAKPDAQDAPDVQKRIGGLQFGLDKAAEKLAQQKAAEIQDSELREKRKTGVEALAGRWHGTAQWAGRGRVSAVMSIDKVGVIRGKDIYFLGGTVGYLHGHINGDRVEDIQWETGYFERYPDWASGFNCGGCGWFPGLSPRPVEVTISDSVTRLRYRMPMYSASDDDRTYFFMNGVSYSFDLTKERD